ncbi:hypothetical protein ABEG17_05860 [Pedococcus sp. KACC 23699]|uniref:DUF4190 domain-containing protein n=1 Tax=Pedococcus sp. KACC 23699 TaxID=3149228 RepID=A0AAU7JXR7_9MICO
MSDTPRNDGSEDLGDEVFRDPTAPSDVPSYGPPSSSGTPEPTVQLPTGGDTRQVPTDSPVPPPPPAPGGEPPVPQNPYASPPPGASPQNPYASPAGDASPQNPYASPPTAQQYPSQDEVAAQHGASAAPVPPGYGQAPAYGQPPAYGQQAYGQPAYGQQPYGAPVGYATGGSLSGGSIALLVVSGLLTIGGCGLGIPALVFAIIAVTKKDEPSEMAKWTRWGWIALGVTIALVVVGFALVIGLAVSTGSGSTSP